MGQIRIIGGRYRGRRLPVPSTAGLRPTSDRIRETVFNWLAPFVEGSRCLDCFAGSGALGLEAASRGAGEVWMIESAGAAVMQLRSNVQLIKAEKVRVIKADALRWLSTQEPKPMDIIFLDPPFASGLLAPAIDKLESKGWVHPGSLLYLETQSSGSPPSLPVAWSLLRHKRAGQVCYGLARVGGVELALIGHA